MGCFLLMTVNDFAQLNATMKQSVRGAPAGTTGSVPLASYQTHGLNVLEQHVNAYHKRFAYDHAQGGKMPRNHDWRPYRFCIQDVLFGTTVVRHNRYHNCLEIDVFLTAPIPEYDELAGAQALAIFCLSEAYKCGGTMELRFTQQVEGGRVPAAFQALGQRYGIKFAESASGRVAPEEAKAFYAALTGFAPALHERLIAMDQTGVFSMTRACYIVHHGIWSREQIEMIVQSSRRPDSVLAGLTQPHQRHLYAYDILHARAALLGGMLDRQLQRRERQDEHGTTYDLEDDICQIEVGFDGKTCAKIYTSTDTIQVPWLYPARSMEIQAGNTFNVLIRARDSADLFLHLTTDLKLASTLHQIRGGITGIVVPRDVFDVPEALRQQFLAQAKQQNIHFMICPEVVQSFDTDAAARLARSRLLRQ
ncbi:MAG: hypothetical protein HC837_09510 [Chloroflexaceae bacterium]|nr:hypothetical protein [Chloroflexaceae bacterium]